MDRRHRLDVELVARGLVATRARARDLILRGEVLVSGCVATKAGQTVSDADVLVLKSGPADYVSRGALKLQHALEHFGFSGHGVTAIDVGASTGGFTETLLKAGADRVYAIENGRGQLHPRLQDDPRVISFEGFDARNLNRQQVPDPVTAIVADVSFLPLVRVLPAALDLAVDGCWLVTLVKPQFEVPGSLVPRSGVVRDAAVHRQAIETVRAWLVARAGWHLQGTTASPIKGGDGNTEFLLGATYRAG
ncbi:MAG: TlyA family RNA methyltransferase [Hyphomicrobiaceae bacterium]